MKISFSWFLMITLVSSIREGNGTPLQYSCLENPWTGEPGGLQSIGVAKSRTRLSDFTFTFHFHALEKEMATHSSVLVWRIPGTEEPNGLLSMGSHRVGHDWSDLAAAAAAAAVSSIVSAKPYPFRTFLIFYLKVSRGSSVLMGSRAPCFLWKDLGF